MLSIITGGRDVDGSAERAPYVARPIDRLAGGVIPVTYSPNGADEILGGVAGACSGIKCGKNRTGTESETSGDRAERHATQVAPEAGVAEAWGSGQPEMIQALTGQSPGSNVSGPTKAGVTSGERAAADRDAGHMPTCALNPRDVVPVGTNFPSRSLTSSQAVVKPEADTLLPSVSGAFPHSPVSMCPVNQPETADPKAPRPAVSGAYSAWTVNPASNSLRSTYP